MTDFEKQMESLGDSIESIIDEAVNSRDFRKLSITIQNAVDAGSKGARRVINETADRIYPRVTVEGRGNSRTDGRRYQPNRNIYSSRIHYDNVPEDQQPAAQNLPAYYGNPAQVSDKGTGLVVGGGVTLGVGGAWMLSTILHNLYVGITGWLLGGSMASPLMPLAVLGIGAGLLTGGLRKKGLAKRFRRYCRLLGSKSVAELRTLAASTGKEESFVRKDVKKMIDQGLFPEGHLDDGETTLIVSDEAYSHYLELKEREAAKAKQAAADKEVQRLEKEREKALKEQEKTMDTIRRQQQEQERKVSAEVQEMLDRGSSFVRQIRACNDAIPGDEISRKISRMEEVVAKILDRAETHPEVVPKLKKLMDYYLPMTIKLLNAYVDLDAQPVQGGNIRKAKEEIENTLDTLNDAFEKLLDSIFQETAMDVSSDISVLQALLAQEGLTDDGLQQNLTL